jgi:hypothetical protein
MPEPISTRELLLPSLLDRLLDDSPEHLGRFPGVRVVYDHPYNRSFAAHHHRIASLAEYVALIRGLARGGGPRGEDGDG